jgi:hypothetical protein
MIILEVLTLDYGTITRNGIVFNGFYFTASIAIREQWFSVSGESESRSIPVYFDSNDPQSILLVVEEVGLVRAIRVQESPNIEDEILQSYFSNFKELRNRWKSKKYKRRRK